MDEYELQERYKYNELNRKFKKYKTNQLIFKFILIMIILILIYVILLSSNNYAYNQNIYKSFGDNDEAFTLNDETESLSIDTINYISTNVIRSTIMVRSYESINILGFRILLSSKMGSGIIYKEDVNYYYALTNNHVIYGTYSYQLEYIIYDYKMRITKGEVIKNDPLYDLAIVRFPKTQELIVSPLASENPDINDVVIAIGNPEGQPNCIGVGEVLDYDIVNCNDCSEDETNVSFECLIHSFIVKPGSSGGVLLNTNYEIVGINTFVLVDEASAAIPVEKIIEFIN